MRKFLRLAMVIFALGIYGYAAKVSGVEVQEQLVFNGKTMQLNGAGVRTKLFFDLYVGSLYLENKNSDAQAIITQDTPMNIRLHMLSSLITSKKMESATRDGFEKSIGKADATMQENIEKFIAVFHEEIVKNDQFDLVYIPNKGVHIYKNGNLKETIVGLDFKQALFGIWLGEDPAQTSLKKSMLGN
jgi:hypothetical protein